MSIGLSGLARPELAWSDKSHYSNSFVKEHTDIPLKQLLRYVHCDNNQDAAGRDDEEYDTCAKFRTLMDLLRENCENHWTLGQWVSLDEQDQGFQGPCKFKERITYKKAGDGFLIYAICDPVGYCYTFYVKFDNKWKQDWYGLAKTFSVVVALIKRIEDSENKKRKEGEAPIKWRTIVMDSLYGNTILAEKLYGMHFWHSLTTLRSNRMPDMADPERADKDNFMDKPFLWLRKSCTTVTKWLDRKNVVKFMTTLFHKEYEPLNDTEAERRRAVEVDPENPSERKADTGCWRKLWVKEKVLNISWLYNHYMNGVDLADQLRVSFNLRKKSNKWWIPILYWLIETAICNSYLCYRSWVTRENERIREGANNDQEYNERRLILKDHRQYRERLSEEMVKNHRDPAKEKVNRASSKASQSRRGVKNPARTEPDVGLDGHWPVQSTESKGARECVCCKHFNRYAKENSVTKAMGAKKRKQRKVPIMKDVSPNPVRTRWMCKKCNQYVCPECMAQWHNIPAQ